MAQIVQSIRNIEHELLDELEPGCMSLCVGGAIMTGGSDMQKGTSARDPREYPSFRLKLPLIMLSGSPPKSELLGAVYFAQESMEDLDKSLLLFHWPGIYLFGFISRILHRLGTLPLPVVGYLGIVPPADRYDVGDIMRRVGLGPLTPACSVRHAYDKP